MRPSNWKRPDLILLDNDHLQLAGSLLELGVSIEDRCLVFSLLRRRSRHRHGARGQHHVEFCHHHDEVAFLHGPRNHHWPRCDQLQRWSSIHVDVEGARARAVVSTGTPASRSSNFSVFCLRRDVAPDSTGFNSFSTAESQPRALSNNLPDLLFVDSKSQMPPAGSSRISIDNLGHRIAMRNLEFIVKDIQQIRRHHETTLLERHAAASEPTRLTDAEIAKLKKLCNKLVEYAGYAIPNMLPLSFLSFDLKLGAIDGVTCLPRNNKAFT